MENQNLVKNTLDKIPESKDTDAATIIMIFLAVLFIFDKPPLLLICGGTEDNYILKRINVFDE